MRSLWLALRLLSLGLYASGLNDNNFNETIDEAFPQLRNFTPNPPTSLPLALGGQNLDHCCLSAVKDALDDSSPDLTLRNKSNSVIFDTDLTDFRNRQFPCGAHYIGERRGAPNVRISYDYCKNNCKGWEISKNTQINQWVSPLVGFLVPAVIFALAIPRRRKVNIPERLFDVPLNEIGSLPRTLYLVPAAAILAAIDTILWLMVIFALAGPILLSGIYEAVLDSRILAYVDQKIEHERLSTAQRAHLLYIVLVGNLDMLAIPNSEAGETTAWDDIDGPDGLLNDLRNVQSGSDENVTNDHRALDKAKTQLRTMLAAQYSFGVTVGAPVVFFCGSFIYTLIENYANLGDNSISHALAFGMWWMTIPHIAIISSFLLAGNNPNILEGVIGHPTVPEAPLRWHFLTLTYDSRYRPAWIWNRGRSKRIWAQRLSQHPFHAPKDFANKLHMSKGDWLFIAFMAYALILIPSVLAFSTSYYTPLIGLSCRSMTTLLYMLCQLWLIALWVWDIEETTLDKEGVPHMPFTCTPWKPDPSYPKWFPYVWYVQVIINVAVATFTAIGGTMMQIMGVYRNCLCSIPIRSWRNPGDVMMPIGTNSGEKIHYALRIWTSAGAGATAFLGFVTFVGWWYQKRLRYQFRLIIQMIGERAEDSLASTQSRQQGG